jgi:hypothetical protein
MMLPVLGSVRFYRGHEQLDRHSTVILEKKYDIRRCPSLPIALPVLFVSSPAVAIFLSLCLIVVSLPRTIDTRHRPSRQLHVQLMPVLATP